MQVRSEIISISKQFERMMEAHTQYICIELIFWEGGRIYILWHWFVIERLLIDFGWVLNLHGSKHSLRDRSIRMCYLFGTTTLRCEYLRQNQMVCRWRNWIDE